MTKSIFIAVGIAVIFCVVCDCNKTANNNVTALPREINDDGIDMVLVDGGTFMTGCSGCVRPPQREVTVDDFYISKYEVTQGQWKAVMDSNPSHFTGDDNLPVESVSWYGAQKFIKMLNAKTGKRYRLPTEAEWEYAARGGNQSKGYEYSGSDDIEEVGWHSNNRGGRRGTRPAGTKRANELGIHDMSGNVSEWTNDVYFDRTKDNYREHPNRAIRGCNWQMPPGYCTVYEEPGHCPPGKNHDALGFRLAMSAGDDASLPEEDMVLEEEDTVTLEVVLPGEDIDAILSGVRIAAASPPDASSNPDSIALVFVEGGTFMMGCVPERDGDYWGGTDFYCPEDEKPAREVTVGGFYISKYEATQGLWTAVMGSNPSEDTGNDNLPVENVDWDDVQAFITKLNAKTGKKYRLPSEAEWEFAARGGNSSKGYWHSGSNNIYKVAWYCENSGYDRGHANTTKPVGAMAPNELGIYDMSGNVWEWTSTANGSDRVRRGGGCGSFSEHCRLFNRYDSDASGYNASPCCYNSAPFGFRLARDP